MPGSLSLRWKILIATSISLVALFAVTATVIEKRIMRTMSESLETEAQASLQAYESLWKARTNLLSAVSLALSGMSDVRAAFGTGDAATIRDLARERWARLSDNEAFFVVADPTGHVIASLGNTTMEPEQSDLAFVRTAAQRFPDQLNGFLSDRDRLFQVVLTPVYVESVRGPALLNVLVAGYLVNDDMVRQIKQTTGGSEFIFLADHRVLASTLPASRAAEIAQRAGSAGRVSDGQVEYASLGRPLRDIEGKRIGNLFILRSFAGAQNAMLSLRRSLSFVWAAALALGLALTYVLATRLMTPIARLDRAAAEIGRENYEYRVPADKGDELGRLARAFNAMCDSIQRGRSELVRQERLSTIGKLSSSLVHDLRNPLAAIYAGSELLAESSLGAAQAKRVAENIYRASKQIQGMLQELLQTSRGKTVGREVCSVQEIIEDAWSNLERSAVSQGIEFDFQLHPDLTVEAERTRLQRVFANLFVNSIEAMPNGGKLRVFHCEHQSRAAIVVEDTGPGIPADLRSRLFEPFATSGKGGGTGLGLALSRQTLRDHGGDLTLDPSYTSGARFIVRLGAPGSVAGEASAAGGRAKA